MPRIRRKLKRPRREWTDAHRAQLQVGWDHFGSGWGCPVTLCDDNQPGAAKLWPTTETLAEMELAWEELGDELLADPQNAHRRPFWAELVFEEGIAPRDALTSRSSHAINPT